MSRSSRRTTHPPSRSFDVPTSPIAVSATFDPRKLTRVAPPRPRPYCTCFLTHVLRVCARGSCHNKVPPDSPVTRGAARSTTHGDPLAVRVTGARLPTTHTGQQLPPPQCTSTRPASFGPPYNPLASAPQHSHRRRRSSVHDKALPSSQPAPAALAVCTLRVGLVHSTQHARIGPRDRYCTHAQLALSLFCRSTACGLVCPRCSRAECEPTPRLLPTFFA